MSLTCGDVPVDSAHVIAILVGAHLVKFHSLALEYRVVLASHRGIHETAGANLDVFHFFEKFFGKHDGLRFGIRDLCSLASVKALPLYRTRVGLLLPWLHFRLRPRTLE